MFDVSGQNIKTNLTYSGKPTNLANAPLGPVHLSGTMTQEVLGRTFSTEPGFCNIDVLDMLLTGLVQGHTLTLGLDGAHSSSGFASIDSIGTEHDPMFRSDSFF